MSKLTDAGSAGSALLPSSLRSAIITSRMLSKPWYT